MLEQLFRRFLNIAKCPGEILGHTDALEHDILYQGPKVIYIPPYKKSSEELDEINTEIINMFEQDLIEASNLDLICLF